MKMTLQEGASIFSYRKAVMTVSSADGSDHILGVIRFFRVWRALFTVSGKRIGFAWLS